MIFKEFKATLLKYGLEYFGRYYGTYRGFVYSNEDPENLGRLQLKVPQIYGEDYNDKWAWPRGMFCGKSIGFYAVPNEGDPVWVTFENGDPSHPLWEYGWFREGDAPQGAGNKTNILQTTSGHRIELNDKEEYIKIKDKSGYVVRLSKDGITIGKGNANLFKFLTDLFGLLKATTTNTMLGPQPFINVVEYQKLELELKKFLTDKE